MTTHHTHNDLHRVRARTTHRMAAQFGKVGVARLEPDGVHIREVVTDDTQLLLIGRKAREAG